MIPWCYAYKLVFMSRIHEKWPYIKGFAHRYKIPRYALKEPFIGKFQWCKKEFDMGRGHLHRREGTEAYRDVEVDGTNHIRAILTGKVSWSSDS